MGTMATKMGIRELRDNLTSVIRRVQGGETVEVTNHGAPVAILSPIPSDRVARLVASGDVVAATAEARPPNRHPITTGTSASQALEDDRAER